MGYQCIVEGKDNWMHDPWVSWVYKNVSLFHTMSIEFFPTAYMAEYGKGHRHTHVSQSLLEKGCEENEVI